jgi:hypothetical protein
MVAIGVAGAISMPVALGGGLAAALAGGLSGAAAGVPFSIVARKLGRVRKAPSQNVTDSPESQSTIDDFCLDDLVRTTVVWALVLELQGNSEEVIVITLQRLLADCHPTVVNSPDGAQELLDEVDERLGHLSAAKTA